MQSRVPTASTANVDTAELLRVQVQQPRRGDHAPVQPKSTSQPRLLVDGEERLDGWQRGIWALLQHGQGGGHPDAVVGPQGGARGAEPLAIHAQADGVRVEVVWRVGVLLADHVHVALQHHRLGCLASAAAGANHQQVASGVLAPGEAPGLGEVLDVPEDRRLLPRGPGDAADLSEVAKELRRLQGADDLSVGRHRCVPQAAELAAPPEAACQGPHSES
mmetsp:Transcript_107774/g.347914  ORF Transcript_107774/g.347914 Transcript_107774/m.347914 type:complete len:219 (-) Transcript_107774:200-856(-)